MKDVVLVTIDCLRSDHVGCYGYNRPTTPNLDALAKEGTLYRYSYANCPGTRWALQSLHAGVSTHRIDGIGLPESAGVTMAEAFAAEGYATFGVADNGFLARSYNYDRGFEEYHSVGHFRSARNPIMRVGEQVRDLIDSDVFSEFVVEPLYKILLKSSGIFEGNDSGVSDSDVIDFALDWLNRERYRPAFMWVHLMDAHTPYVRRDGHLRAVRGNTDVEHVVDPGRQGYVTHGSEPPQAVIDAYDAGIRSADEQLGRLVDRLPRETVFAVTGDHGEEFGQYNEFHRASLYSSLTQVPIVIRAPDLPRTTIETHWAQHLDVPPTLLSSADVGAPEYWDGASLQRCERTLETPLFFDVWDDDHAVRRNGWKLINREGDPPELYEVPHGGREVEPTDGPDVEAELQSLLDEHVRHLRRDPVGSAHGHPEDEAEELDDDVRESLEELGYID